MANAARDKSGTAPRMSDRTSALDRRLRLPRDYLDNPWQFDSTRRPSGCCPAAGASGRSGSCGAARRRCDCSPSLPSCRPERPDRFTFTVNCGAGLSEARREAIDVARSCHLALCATARGGSTAGFAPRPVQAATGDWRSPRPAHSAGRQNGAGDPRGLRDVSESDEGGVST